MRIGQILIEAELISAKQLSNGLEYGQVKGIALGRVLKLLKIMTEEDIERALHAQKLIRMGLSPVLALEALKVAVKQQCSLDKALQGRHEAILKAPMEKEEAKANFVELDYANPPEKLIEDGDKLLLIDKVAEAEANYEQARKVLEKQYGRNHINLAPVLVRLGNTYMATDRFDQAEECYEEVLVLRIRALPGDDPEIAQAYESMADLYKARGDETQATENYQQALDILEKKLPAQLGIYTAILRRIAAAANLAASKEGEPKKLPVGEILKGAGLLTEEQLQSALRKSKQSREPVGTVLRDNNIVKERDFQSALKSQFYISQGILSEALALDLLARAARREISLERLLHEANILMSDDEKSEATREIAIYLDQLVAAESSSTANKNEVAPIAHKVAELYEKVGDKRQAEIYYARALKIWGADIKGEVAAARTCSALARLQMGQKKYSEVVPLLMKALEHRQMVLGANHEETIETLEDIAEAELAQLNSMGAYSFLRGAMASREGLGHMDGQLFRCVALSADCNYQMGNYDEAESLYQRAVVLAQAGFGSVSPALAAVVEKLGDLYTDLKKDKEASAQYNYAFKILKASKKLDSDAGRALQEKIEKVKTAST